MILSFRLIMLLEFFIRLIFVAVDHVSDFFVQIQCLSLELIHYWFLVHIACFLVVLLSITLCRPNITRVSILMHYSTNFLIVITLIQNVVWRGLPGIVSSVLR